MVIRSARISKRVLTIPGEITQVIYSVVRLVLQNFLIRFGHGKEAVVPAAFKVVLSKVALIHHGKINRHHKNQECIKSYWGNFLMHIKIDHQKSGEDEEE